MRSVHKTSKPGQGAAGTRVIIYSDPAGSRPLGAHPCRMADRIAARALGTSLDRKLAAGCSPESARLLAVRASGIVQLVNRRRLARYWDRVRRVAGSGKEPALAVPLCRSRVAAAQPDIRELARLLRAPLPVGARGVAMARVLLTDGGGPLYRDSPASLSDELRKAIAWLDPEQPLAVGAATVSGRG